DSLAVHLEPLRGAQNTGAELLRQTFAEAAHRFLRLPVGRAHEPERKPSNDEAEIEAYPEEARPTKERTRHARSFFHSKSTRSLTWLKRAPMMLSSAACAPRSLHATDVRVRRSKCAPPSSGPAVTPRSGLP